MTDEQIMSLWNECRVNGDFTVSAAALAFARKLLATPAPLSDEPVAEEKLMEVANRVASEFRELASKLPPAVLANLFAAPTATPSDKQEAVIGSEWRAIFNEVRTGASFEQFCEWMREEIAAPLAQSAEQDVLAKVLFALTERQKGNVIRSEDEYVDEARVVLKGAREKLKSAEQDRIDAERWRNAMKHIDSLSTKGASK
ncbi:MULTISPECIES: hypothetical protein [unclassified Caballeronia]|uniref:hypothetical protein n=1 Tax=unclassified Caballeronia TaxID=2646786 RepID=UPI0020287305|nr:MULTISPECIES: hypothetical protein [unclassified Caballeronia]